MSTPHPIILCGKTEAIGAVVIEKLKPEFETISFIQSVAAGRLVIPALLRGEVPDPATHLSQLGTRNFVRTPVAVVLGAAFGDEDVDALRDAVRGAAASDVAWLRPDRTTAMPPPGPAYGEAMVRRIKKRVGEMDRKGEWGTGGVVWF